MNFKYHVRSEEQLNYAAIDKSLKVKDYGIKKVAVVMNMAQIRESDDSHLSVIDAADDKIKFSKDMKALLESVKRNDIMKD